MAFQSTPSAREGDSTTPARRQGWRFNPRLPRGKATLPHGQRALKSAFQSTPSAREGDSYISAWVGLVAFQSTPSAREGDIEWLFQVVTIGSFNPRLPRGKATIVIQYAPGAESFNPRLPRGKATDAVHRVHDAMQFQSTPSAREGDIEWLFQVVTIGSFNPRLPRGKATIVIQYAPGAESFNPRLPRGKATDAVHRVHDAMQFQSTPSAREGDRTSFCLPPTHRSFNPRLPRGKATASPF